MEFATYTPLLWLLVLIPLGLGWFWSLVDRPTGLKVASFALRLVGVVLLALVLCRPFWKTESDQRHTLYLVDVSESVDLASVRDRLSTLKEELAATESGDTWSLFAVARGIRNYETVEELDEVLEQWGGGVQDDAFRSDSQLGEAMLEARIGFPSGKARQLVLISDGQVPDDEALVDAITVLGDEEVTMQFESVDGLRQSEAAVVSIEPSTPTAFENEVVRLRVDIAANEAMKAQLRILHKGVVAVSREVELKQGSRNRFSFDVTMTTPGAGQWVAELVPERDYFPINNQLASTITVKGQPRVLVLHRKPTEMRSFSRLLEEQDFEVDVRGGKGLPESLEEMLAFDAILIADVPATEFTLGQMELMRRFVSDFGGGLAMLGSENSYGLGGYYKTPVEEVLPLTSRFEKEKEKPSMAMVLVIDKSGSMDGLPIQLARQAAKSTVELLSGRDQIAVIGFDSNPQIIVEMRSASDRVSVQAAIDSLAAGGGTDVFPSMVAGQEMLDTAAAKIKHMIILSDGQTAQADHLGLAREMADSGITVSTVALGDGADRELMSGIAEVGRGRYYETLDPNSVPQIFTKETMQASKSAIKEDLIGVVQVGDHPMLAGYAEAELPFTLGYVMTEAKSTAQVLLIAETGDPMLAISRFGLGTGMAYASDLTEMWGGEWLAWSDGGKFWAQALRSLVRKADVEGVRTESRVEGESWIVDIERTDPDGSPVPRVNWDAAVLREGNRSEAVTVSETGLGRYQLKLSVVAGEDRISLRLHDRESDKLKVLHYEASYPAEYRLGSEVPEALQNLAEPPSERITTSRHRPVGHWFAWAALGCFLGGMVLRRI